MMRYRGTWRLVRRDPTPLQVDGWNCIHGGKNGDGEPRVDGVNLKGRNRGSSIFLQRGRRLTSAGPSS